MDERELRLYRCCFTGHRPEKLKQPEETIINGLMREIDRAIADGCTTFITGMARGVDIWAGEAVLARRNEGTPIRLICAIPYPGFESRWSEDWRRRFQMILDKADLVRFISPRYSTDCFQKRNEWMVNHAARVIAVFSGERSGTKNTIDYAEVLGVSVFTIQG